MNIQITQKIYILIGNFSTFKLSLLLRSEAGFEEENQQEIIVLTW